MKGTCNKRIEKCIHVKLERDKAFERLEVDKKQKNYMMRSHCIW